MKHDDEECVDGATLEERRRELIEGLRSGSSDEVERAQQGLVQVLREDYLGPGPLFREGEDAGPSMDRVEALMQAWNPLGFRAADVTTLLGAPDSGRPGRLEYRFDTGFETVVWRFRLEADEVVGLRRLAGE